MPLPASGPAFPLSATDLARWAKFALKGGIGKAVAKADRLADLEEDLMFLQEDEVVVLLDLDDGNFLGFCEGVVGKFHGDDVTLTTKLKRPVLMPRNSFGAPPPSSTPSSALSSPALPSESAQHARTKSLGDLTTTVRAGAGEHTPPAFALVRTVPGVTAVGADAGVEVVDSSRSTGEEQPRALPWVQANDLPASPKAPRTRPATQIFTRTTSVPAQLSPASTPSSSPSLESHSPRSAFTATPMEALTPPLPCTDDESDEASPPLGSTARFTPPPPSPPLSVHHPSSPRPDTPPKDDTLLFSAPPLHSKFSDASLASSAAQPRSKFSDGPSLLDFSNVSPPRGQLPQLSLSDYESPTSDRTAKSSSGGWSSSTASGGASSPVNQPPTPGEETELFGAIFDSYRYSRDSLASSPGGASSVGGGRSPSPSSPSDSPAVRRRLGPSPTPSSSSSSPVNSRRIQLGASPSPSTRIQLLRQATPDGHGEDDDSEEEEDEDDPPITPLRYGAASALRTQLVAQHSAGSSGSLTPVHSTRQPTLPSSDSTESVLTASIPRLRDLFPRSSTTESFGSLSSMLSSDSSPSSSATNSPNKPWTPHKWQSSPSSSTASPSSAASPSPSPQHSKLAPPPSPHQETNEDGVPVPRRLFQTYFSPPREGAAHPPRSKAVLGLPDSPSASPTRNLRKRRPSAPKKSLVIGAPVPNPGAQWKSSSESPTNLDDDIFSKGGDNADSGELPTPTTTLTFLTTLSGEFPAPPSTAASSTQSDASSSSAPSVAIHAPGSSFPPMSDFVDDNPPPLHNAWMPKLTIPSDSPSPTTFEYALRPAPAPLAANAVPVCPASPEQHDCDGSTPECDECDECGEAQRADSAQSLTRSTRSETSIRSTSLPRSKSVGSLGSSANSTGPTRLRKQPSIKRQQQQQQQAAATTLPLSRSVSHTLSHSLADAHHHAPPPEDAPPSHNVLTKSSSTGSIFPFAGRKRANTLAASYGIGSKDFESERVHVKNADFDMVKPLAVLLLSSSTDSPMTSSLGSDPSIASSTSQSSLADVMSSPVIYGRPSMSSADVFDEPEEEEGEEGAGTDPANIAIYRAREKEWVKTMSSTTAHTVKRSKKMKALVQNGVPSSVRGKVWSYLAEVSVDKVEGLYDSLCALDTGIWEDAIAIDVATVFRDDPQFAPDSLLRDDLESVLNALSRYDSELGYAKGLALTAGLILSHVPAEETFWILVALINRFNFRSYFACAFDSLLLEVRVFSNLLDNVDPKLATHLRKVNAGPESFLPSWLSTLFATALPSSTRLRTTDFFFYGGPSSALRVALAILDLARARLLACESRKEVLELLLRGIKNDGSMDQRRLMPTIFTTKISDDKIKQARKKAEQSLGKSVKGKIFS